jgi:hypothetical protein
MRKIYITALVLCSIAFPARANTVFVPTSGWLVGPATLVADDEGQLPCVMMNQFNNGFVMRISGGGEQIMGFALDVRQAVFTAGETYDLGVAIEPGFRKIFKAQAYDTATIMAATQDAPELYEALQNAREMTLGVQGKPIKFVMLGVRDGLERVESCFDPKGTARPAPRRAAAAAPVDDESPTRPGMRTADAPAPKEDSVAAAYRDLLLREEGDKAAAVTAPAAPSKDVDIPLTAKAQGQTMPPASTAIRPQPPQVAQPDTVAALDKMEPSAGGDSRLDRIFAKAEESIRTQKPADAVPAPAAVTAQAVKPALRPAPAAPARAFPTATYQGQPLLPNGMVPIAPPAPPAPRQMQVSPPDAQPVSAPAQAAAHSREWRAQPGTHLREVLENWSINAGARLVWKAQGDFTMPAGLTAQGTYESAVLSALKQFESGDGVQPLGQIYSDPATGQKVLVISE